MMQMLAAGGMPILADQHRPADEDNPRGYLELAAVKNTQRDASWLQQAPGHAVKVIHFLLPMLPSTSLPYRVIMMRRPLDEVLRSQVKMLERNGKTPPPQVSLKQIFAQQMKVAEEALSQRNDMTLLDVAYADTIQEPRQTAERVSAFLGEVKLEISPMAECVDASLYRQRLG